MVYAPSDDDGDSMRHLFVVKMAYLRRKCRRRERKSIERKEGPKAILKPQARKFDKYRNACVATLVPLLSFTFHEQWRRPNVLAKYAR